MWTWLADLLQVLGDLIPRFIVVRTDEWLVEFRFGKWPRVLGAGWYIKWPAIAAYEEIIRKPLFCEREQRFGDEAYRWRMCYEVNDPLMYATRVSDYADAIPDAGELAFVRAFHEGDIEDEERIASEVSKDLKDFGIEVLRFSICSHGQADFCFSIWELHQHE